MDITSKLASCCADLLFLVGAETMCLPGAYAFPSCRLAGKCTFAGAASCAITWQGQDVEALTEW